MQFRISYFFLFHKYAFTASSCVFKKGKYVRRRYSYSRVKHRRMMIHLPEKWKLLFTEPIKSKTDKTFHKSRCFILCYTFKLDWHWISYIFGYISSNIQSKRFEIWRGPCSSKNEVLENRMTIVWDLTSLFVNLIMGICNIYLLYRCGYVVENRAQQFQMLKDFQFKENRQISEPCKRYIL